MTMAISQHWVPQFYLGGFTTSKNGVSLWVTDIKRAYAGDYQHSKDRVREVAQQDHLYSLPLEDGVFEPTRPVDGWDDSVDKFLQAIESDSGHIWKRLRENPAGIDLSPGSAARMTVATFLASLHLRNPRMVAVAKLAEAMPSAPPLVTQQDRDAFYDQLGAVAADLSPTLEGTRDRRGFLNAQRSMLDDVRDTLLSLHWTVQLYPGNSAAGPLLTSDTPLFCVEQETMEPTTMASPRCMVFCPLTSRALLIATRAKTPTPNGAMVTSSATSAAAINPFIVHYGVQEAYSGFQLTNDFPFLRDVSGAG